MNRKLAIAIVMLLLAGAVAIAIVQTIGKPDSAGNGDSGGDGTPPKPDAAGSGGGMAATAGSKASDRSAEEVRDAELVEQYGSARTKLARKISTDIVSLLDDAAEMGETMSEFSGGRMRAYGALRGTGIKLTDEQQEKVADLFAAYQKKEVERSRTAINSVRNNPTSLMELLLAGDAKERGEMSEEDYALVQASAGEELMGVINPLDRDNFRGGSPMNDEQFRGDFMAILDEEQAGQYTAKEAEREAEREARRAEREAEQAGNQDQPQTDIPEGNISNLPTMELETLDEAIGSAKQMTSGIKQVMEGLGGLRDLQPKIEGTGNAEPE